MLCVARTPPVHLVQVDGQYSRRPVRNVQGQCTESAQKCQAFCKPICENCTREISVVTTRVIDSQELARMIGRRIADGRHAIGLSQTELAKRLHVSHATISRWESGETPISIEDLGRLIPILDRSLVFFLGAPSVQEQREPDPEDAARAALAGIRKL